MTQTAKEGEAMAIVRCDAGHFYDDRKTDACPHCAGGRAGGNDEKTVSGAGLTEAISRTVPKQVIDMGSPAPGDEKTVGIYRKKHGQDPVTGWLVSVKGSERGRDYRLHSGRNFLGRAAQMDIAVTDDAQISRENHCSIVFDPKSHTFMLVPGSANTYLNGEAVTAPATLKSSDIIGAGDSEFAFVPFCSENRTWEN